MSTGLILLVLGGVGVAVLLSRQGQGAEVAPVPSIPTPVPVEPPMIDPVEPTTFDPVEPVGPDPVEPTPEPIVQPATAKFRIGQAVARGTSFVPVYLIKNMQFQVEWQYLIEPFGPNPANVQSSWAPESELTGFSSFRRDRVLEPLPVFLDITAVEGGL